MKKSKNDIASEIQKIHQLKAKALLGNLIYIKKIKAYEDLAEKNRKKTLNSWEKAKKDKEILEEIRKGNEICDNFELAYPLPLDELEAIADGKTFFIGEFEKYVHITEAEPDRNGFLDFKIKASVPRYMIHYLLDLLLDAYESKGKKKRLRIGYVNPFEVGYKERLEGKNPLRIAKEREGVNNLKGKDANPAYNSQVKYTYEQVKRASKIAKEKLFFKK